VWNQSDRRLRIGHLSCLSGERQDLVRLEVGLMRNFVLVFKKPNTLLYRILGTKPHSILRNRNLPRIFHRLRVSGSPALFDLHYRLYILSAIQKYWIYLRVAPHQMCEHARHQICDFLSTLSSPQRPSWIGRCRNFIPMIRRPYSLYLAAVISPTVCTTEMPVLTCSFPCNRHSSSGDVGRLSAG
jgi:hypothetical protein